MTRKQELLKKIPQIARGEMVRPPKEWWDSMWEINRKQYPKFKKERIDRITAGIWHKYSKAVKIGIVKRISEGENGIPNPSRNNDDKKLMESFKRMSKGMGKLKQEIEKEKIIRIGCIIKS